MPNGRCYRHGGATPKGIASPHFRHGRYSQDLPSDLLDRYEAGARDEDLHALDAEITVVTARAASLLARLKDGEGWGSWTDALACYQAFHAANRGQDRARALEAITTLGTILTAGQQVERLWEQVNTQFDLRRRLVEADSRRRKDLHQMISVDRALAFGRALTAAVKRHVTDPQTLNAIESDFAHLIAGRHAGEPPR